MLLTGLQGTVSSLLYYILVLFVWSGKKNGKLPAGGFERLSALERCRRKRRRRASKFRPNISDIRGRKNVRLLRRKVRRRRRAELVVHLAPVVGSSADWVRLERSETSAWVSCRCTRDIRPRSWCHEAPGPWSCQPGNGEKCLSSAQHHRIGVWTLRWHTELIFPQNLLQES